MSITKIAAKGVTLRIGTVAAAVTSITLSSTTATVVTTAAHGLVTGDIVLIAGAAQAEYNGVKQITVTDSTTFTFTAASGTASPATGTITFLGANKTYEGLKTITPSMGERGMINVTTHDSSVSKEYVPAALIETAQLDVEASYDSADTVHELMRAAHEAGSTIIYSFTLPDAGAAKWSGFGICTAWAIPTLDPEESDLAHSFTIKGKSKSYFNQ